MLNPDQSTNRFNAHINYADGPTFGNTYWDFGQVSGGGRLQVSAPSNSVNAWVHYALVASQSGTAMRIYANGNLIASKTGMSPFVRGSFELRIGGPGFPYNGRLDEFRIWNTARSQAQIQASLGAPLTGNETNLLLYYRFDSASGTVATNSATLTGTAYNGTLVNSPTWVASTAPSTVVLNTNDAGAYSLRSAISNAPAGSTITFDPSLSGKTILLTNGEITLNKNLTIDASALANGIVINGNNASRIFNVAASTTNVLTALTLTNGNADGSGGGGIGNSGTLTLNRCTLTGNHANTPGNGGGAISSSGPLTLNQCTIVGNQATGSGGVGGGIYNYFSILNVNQSTITSNTAVSGGGIYKQNGTMNLTNSIICNNTALFNPNISGSSSSSNNLVDVNALLAPLGNYGGPTPTMPPLPGSPAIDAGSDSAASQFTTDQRGFARKVGAHVDIGAVEVSPTDFNRVVTTAADSGTGSLRQVIADANPGSTITFSNTLSGQTILLISGELLLNKNLTIDGSSLTNAVQLNGNHASRIFSVNSGTTNVLNSLTITNGYSSGTFPNYNGGGIYNAGSLTVNNCTLAGNTNRGASVGGGIYNNSGSLTVNQSTLSGNHSDGYGGGIKNDGTLTVNQSTVSGNSASGTPGASGGGIANYTGTLNLTNSIVAGNTATVIADIAGTITTSGGVNLTNGTPLLAPLGNYGGPTKTMALLPASPARNAATGSTITSDQRGFPIVGGTPDIGAYEAGTLNNFNAWVWELLPATATVAQHAASFDFDGDGVNNGAEFAAGTNPLVADNPNTPLNLSVVRNANGTLTLSFPTATGRTYSLLQANTLPGTFGSAGVATVAGNGATRSFTVTPPANLAARFYRVTVSP